MAVAFSEESIHMGGDFVRPTGVARGDTVSFPTAEASGIFEGFSMDTIVSLSLILSVCMFGDATEANRR
jgi:hypothetical protein